ncbi:MAG: DegT/DnrJ/EryC1/StrS family aminotransferase [Betaproteobacteria bacterium]|nr:DegT/DnrJ/EryC1/StrS family aminotransferase [Betaproteobacteria bacterium]
MSTEKLAIHGGPKTIVKPLKRYNSIGIEEVKAAMSVVESGVLSQFLGCWDPDFYGGPKVQEFERACEAYFGVKHAVTVNSWTSGLIAAVGAIGIEPGDEVIVPPWTMCASATAILHWNAIPVFADIEPETFNLDPKSVEDNITPFTRAIMAVDIFGHSCDIETLMEIAKRHKLKVITDSAQSPGVFCNGRMTGTFADVGGYSLNYHKHIHTGEGGILVTNDSYIYERLLLIRNHAEAVVAAKGVDNLANMIGYNFRLGEIESAIGIEQLRKLDGFIGGRQQAAQQLTNGFRELPGLRLPMVKPGCSHAYYIYPMILDIANLGVSRHKICSALESEGVVGLAKGYSNLHVLPMFQKKIAYGSNGFPWSSDICRREVSYAKGICPVAEDLHDSSFMAFEMCLHELNDEEAHLIVKAFKKVWSQISSL